VTLNIDLIWKVCGIIFACGVIYGELKAIRKDIARLEAKQDKYNHLQERMARVEEGTKSAHKRIDALEGK
jgi:hypothetical protein